MNRSLLFRLFELKKETCKIDLVQLNEKKFCIKHSLVVSISDTFS